MLTIDLETNRSHSTIWCAGVQDHGSSTASLCLDKKSLQQTLSTCDGLVGHNIIGFDLPVLQNCWQINPDVPVWDTLVMARLLKPVIDGGHSLKSWGKRLKFDKLDFDVEDFDSGYTEEMGTYCKRDVEVTTKLYRALVVTLEAKGFSQYSIDLEHKVAEITAQQIRNGFKLDVELAQSWTDEMGNRLDEIQSELQSVFPPIITMRISEKTGKRLKDHVEEFNVGSRQQIAKRLTLLGAQFIQTTPKGAPVVNEKTLAAIDLPEAKLCSEYLGLVKIKGMVDSWLAAAAPETGRIHGRVNSCGAITGRMTHSSPNLAQIPSLQKARKCFTVDDGNVLVGCDASGLELRCMAHYMNDPQYTKVVVEGVREEGTDIHTVNQNIAGLRTRDQAKTMIYALVYGAGNEKMGEVIGGSAKSGAALKEKFLRGLPSLKKLIEGTQREAKRSGCLTGIDGRKVWVDDDYKALNRLLQSCGAIIMKVAVVKCVETLNARRIPFKLVAQVHDEFQIETPEHFGNAVGKIARQSIIDAGIELNLNCPMDGEYAIGKTWADTH